MQGAAAGEGEIGDLVLEVAGGGEALLQEGVLGCTQLVGGLPVAAGDSHLSEDAALLNAHLVGGNMLRPQPQHGIQVITPQLHQFFIRRGAAPPSHRIIPENQVQRDIVEPGGTQHPEGLHRPIRTVPPGHPPQAAVAEGLHAHTDAVHSEPPQGPGVGLRDIVRIDLNGKFREDPDIPPAIPCSRDSSAAPSRSTAETTATASPSCSTGQSEGVPPPT